MGRPDTLGVDLYHNRQYPKIEDEASHIVTNSELLDPPQGAIIKCMVDFSRITRSVCLGIYLSASPPQRNLSLAFRIEQDLDSWLDNLPPSIRPSRTCESERSLKRIKDAQWMKKQRLVLSISKFPFALVNSDCADISRIPQRAHVTLRVLPHGLLVSSPHLPLPKHLPGKYLQMLRIRQTNHRNYL